MLSNELSLVQQLKIHCLSRGIQISKEAEDFLSCGGKVPLSIHEYATTGGVTLEIEGGVFINAPFNEWYCIDTGPKLDVNPANGKLEVIFAGESNPAQALPLPGYLNKQDTNGHFIKETVMSHTDRARISPIFGCAFSCRFCDFVGKKYIKRPVEQIIDGFHIALQDEGLPVKHAIISGGTPSLKDYGYLDDVFEKVIRTSNVPMDVMLAPRRDDIIDRLADWGIHGYSINIEIYDEDVAERLAPQKHKLGNDLYATCISRAVERVGNQGRVRSLILVGLEPEESVLKGVEFLARLGCDPVLSPFRPAAGTPLADVLPPSVEMLERVYLKSREITERFGVKLGPRCIPCQHNTLTFPDDSGAYYYS